MDNKKDPNYWQDRVNKLKLETIDNSEEMLNRYIVIYRETWIEISETIKELEIKISTGNYMRSDWYKYNRMLKLEKEINRLIQDLAKKEIQFTKDLVVSTYKKAAKEILKDLNISFSTIDKTVIDHIVNNPWAGQYFSKRVWRNVKDLGFILNDILTRGINQGKSIANIINEMQEATKKARYKCERLVRTEVMRALNQAYIDSYNKAKINLVQRIETPDNRICKICLKAHGKVYKIEDAPTLPIHPH